MRRDTETASTTNPSLVRRLGVAGFLFFLVKGLLWIIVPAIAVVLT